MKILSWNCNGAFRKKIKEITIFNADILVIQECENPAESTDKSYTSWAQNYLWVGENKHKGLGVFCKNEMMLKKLDWSPEGLELFLPCQINNEITLLAVWTKANSSSLPYIGQLWKYLQLHLDKIEASQAIIAGDFNSNKIWDQPGRAWNHSEVVKLLEGLGLESTYHRYFKEEQGKESLPTLYLQRKEEKPYHVDYIFASKKIINEKLNNTVEVGELSHWLQFSDHMPVVFVIE